MPGRRSTAAFALLAAIAGAFGQSPAPPPVQLESAAYVDPDGALVPLERLTIRGGLIAELNGAADGAARRDAYPGAVISPGLIDCFATLGVSGELNERSAAVQPELNAADALNRYSPQLAAALRAGVTTFALVPEPSNVIGGTAAVCLTSGAGGQPQVLGDGPMLFSLAPDAFLVNRDPTSRQGGIDLLRRTLAAARERSDDPLKRLLGSPRPVMLVAPASADVFAAHALGREFGLRFAVVHTRDAHVVAPALKGELAYAIVGPLDLACDDRAARAAACFERDGIAVALAGGLPVRPADSVRIAAAVAARHGLSAGAARRAITRTAAEVLGIADLSGQVKPGLRADLVVFSGDPLDLRSRVLAVYIDGRRVYRAGGPGAGELP